MKTHSKTDKNAKNNENDNKQWYLLCTIKSEFCPGFISSF